MIQVRFQDSARQELITKAFIRSFTRAQVNVTSPALVLVSDQVLETDRQKKIIVFGKTPSLEFLSLAKIISDEKDGQAVAFLDHVLTANVFPRMRAFERFDFTNEWNNLGYGRIEKSSDSPFGIAETSSLYAGLYDSAERSVLWVNRNVGPLDGFDWRMVEDFVSTYRKYELGGIPRLAEIPDGYQAAATMRIDCDENIVSGRPLFELYRKNNFPFSMAIKTKQKIGSDEIKLMREVIDAGGSIVSHSHTHAPDWGGDQAQWEAETSIKILEDALPGYKIRYAVSPFHQNSMRAIEGIKAAGIEGFVGGIIHNDPEYLFARAGEVPFVEGIISHSQQCMFHGDCYHAAHNSIEVYLAALRSAIKTQTFFGFLDHPFSNYQYGWKNEDERLGVHQEFLDELNRVPDLWKASLVQALDFLKGRFLK
jgi:hypothetical protein